MNKHSLIVAMMVACGVVTLSTMAGCAVTSGQSSVGQYVDDKTITARVKTRMAADPTVSAMRIDVTTLNGTVQLSGFATSPTEKAKAGEIAAAVPDVKSVRNDIVVRAAQ
jgi:hyperosmotically inducible protein